MKHLITRFLLLAMCVLSGQAAAAIESYWIDDGRSLTPTQAYGDPDEIKPDRWEVRLYRNGETPGAPWPAYWGSISGKSAREVMDKLKRSQEFQIRYARWAGFDYRTERDTHFNPLGPIAVMKPPAKIPNPLKALFDEAMRMRGKLRDHHLIDLDRLFGDNNPFGSVGRVVREYGDSLLHAQQQLDRLEGLIGGVVEPAEWELQDTLEQFKRDMDNAESKAKGLASMSSKPSVNSGGWQHEIIYKNENEEGRFAWDLTLTNNALNYRERQVGKKAEYRDSQELEKARIAYEKCLGTSSDSPKGGCLKDGNCYAEVPFFRACRMEELAYQRLSDAPKEKVFRDFNETSDLNFEVRDIRNVTLDETSAYPRISLQLTDNRALALSFKDDRSRQEVLGWLVKLADLQDFHLTGGGWVAPAELQRRRQAAEEAERQRRIQEEQRHLSAVASQWTQAAVSARQRGDVPAAVQAYESARQARPDLKGPHLGMAELHAGQGNADQLQTVLARAVQEARLTSADVVETKSLRRYVAAPTFASRLPELFGTGGAQQILSVQAAEDARREKNLRRSADLQAEIEKKKRDQAVAQTRYEEVKEYHHEDCKPSGVLMGLTLGLSALVDVPMSKKCYAKKSEAESLNRKIGRFQKELDSHETELRRLREEATSEGWDQMPPRKTVAIPSQRAKADPAVMAKQMSSCVGGRGYRGLYSGGAKGTWTVVVDGMSGNLYGYYLGDQPNLITGSLNSDTARFRVSDGDRMTIEGGIAVSGDVTGGWTAPGASGTVTGWPWSASPPAGAARNVFQGTAWNTQNPVGVGVFSVAIDGEGKIIGNAQSALGDALAVSGAMDTATRRIRMGSVTNGITFTGELDSEGNVISGTWTDTSHGVAGKFSGCRLGSQALSSRGQDVRLP